MTYMLLSISFRRYNNSIIESAQAPTIFDYSGQSMRFKVANYSRLEIRLDTLHIYTGTQDHLLLPQRGWSRRTLSLPLQHSLLAFMSYLFDLFVSRTCCTSGRICTEIGMYRVAQKWATGHPISLQIFRKPRDRIALKLVDFCNIMPIC